MKLREVIETDSKFRVHGVTGDLFSLDDINYSTEWDYSFPTFCSDSMSQTKLDPITDADFSSKFFNRLSILQNLDFSNLLIAGGFVSKLLFRNGTTVLPRRRRAAIGLNNQRDIDIFIYGLTEQEANQKVRSLILHICNNSQQNTRRHMIIVEKHALSLFVDNEKFQIIFRLYKSISEILHGFDLGSSAVGFDGQRVYFTSLSKFCYENMCNIVDTTRRSPSYEYRLKKYFDRGFRIVLPSLDIKRLDTKNLDYGYHELCLLPFMMVSYKKINGNKIELHEFLTQNKWMNGRPSDYYQSEKTVRRDHMETKIAWMIADETVRVSFGDGVKRVLDGDVCITDKDIDLFYEKMKKQMYHNSRLNIDILRSYFSITSMDGILGHLFSKTTLIKFFDQAIDKEKQSLKQKIKNSSVPYVIQWITKNPGSQLTSSFHPIVEKASDWYGKYFLKQTLVSDYVDVDFVFQTPVML
jgi:hypothetical protein